MRALSPATTIIPPTAPPATGPIPKFIIIVNIQAILH